jgi:hypothetical protein
MRFLIFLVSFNLFALEISEWDEYKPGGKTKCARGGEYSFFVKEGDPKKVVIDFMGGGACWSKETCEEGEPAIYFDSIERFMSEVKKDVGGVYDKEDGRNPLKDWTHIVIPLCTADIHAGENDQVYGNSGHEFTIYHRGGVNAKAALDFVAKNYFVPEKVLVAGCSGGAYGSIFWLPFIRSTYPNSKMYQFADSGVGVITDNFYQEHAVEKWKIWKNIDLWVPGMDPEKIDNIVDLYLEVGDFHPSVRMSQFNYDQDTTQKLFYFLMGGRMWKWKKNMYKNLEDIDSSLGNFNYYVKKGTDHCVLPYKRFYETEVGGIKLGDWLHNLITDGYIENRKD